MRNHKMDVAKKFSVYFSTMKRDRTLEHEARGIGYGDTWQVLVRFVRGIILVTKQL